MSTGPHDDTQRQPWVGRASARPPVDPWPTAEQPIVPPHFAPPPQVVYVEAPRRRRGALFALGVLVAIVAGAATLALIASPALRGAIGMGDPPTSPTTTTPSPTPSPTPPPPPGIGDPVRDGKFEFVVLGVECGIEEVGSGLITNRADGQFCVFDITVENIGDSGVGFLTDSAQNVHTEGGESVNAALWAGLVANGSFDVAFKAIDPGDTVTGKLVFDIPIEDTILTIELHDSLLSDGVMVHLTP